MKDGKEELVMGRIQRSKKKGRKRKKTSRVRKKQMHSTG